MTDTFCPTCQGVVTIDNVFVIEENRSRWTTLGCGHRAAETWDPLPDGGWDYTVYWLDEIQSRENNFQVLP